MKEKTYPVHPDDALLIAEARGRLELVQRQLAALGSYAAINAGVPNDGKDREYRVDPATGAACFVERAPLKAVQDDSR